MKPGHIHRHGSIAWMGLFAILLVALAPTVSQVAASLRHAANANAVAMAEAHAGHASHDVPSHATAHADHGASHAGDHGTPPDDCWSACGYCDLFGHVPALELPSGAGLVASALPAPAIESVRRVFVDAVRRPLALPRGPPLPFA